jgi:hypothetical protein
LGLRWGFKTTSKVKEGDQMGYDSKTTAAIAAVLQYIKTEEEAIAMQSAMQAAQPQMPWFAQPTAPAAKAWGVSGRQAQMQMRNLMQLRTFRKL